MRVKIISAPPGLGKSYFCEWRESFNCLDTDSSKYSKNKIACTKQFPTITDLFKEGLL